MNRRRWWALVSAVAVAMIGALWGVGVPGAVASGDEDSRPSNGELGVYPDHGPSRQTFLDKGGRWRDGWCRRGEGYSVVVDVSGAPEDYRGDLTPTLEHVKKFGPTVADGWIVRCHEGPYGAKSSSPYTGMDWLDVAESVGLEGHRVFSQDDLTTGCRGGVPVFEIMHVRTRCLTRDIYDIYRWNFAFGIRPDASGDLSGGWPPDGSAVDDPWPSAGAGNRVLPLDASGDLQKSDVVDGAVVYIEYGHEDKDCFRGQPDIDVSERIDYVCLGEAARHPRMYPGHPERTLIPQYGVDEPKPAPTPSEDPRPQPSAPTAGPTRDPGSGNGPHPHRPRHTRRPTPPARPHPGQHHDGSNGRGGSARAGHGGVVRRGEMHAGDRVSSQVRKAARTPSPSAPPPTSATPSVSASPSPSVSPSATPSPSVSAGVVVSPSPGDGRVWGSEQQGPSASDGARRRVPGWAWGAGAGVLLAAGVVAWWVTRGRRRDREDDEVGTDLFE